MPTGTVKWYNPEKGYGFIEPDDRTVSLFINEALLKPLGLYSLAVGEPVKYDVDVRQAHVRVIAMCIVPTEPSNFGSGHHFLTHLTSEPLYQNVLISLDR